MGSSQSIPAVEGPVTTALEPYHQQPRSKEPPKALRNFKIDEIQAIQYRPSPKQKAMPTRLSSIEALVSLPSLAAAIPSLLV
jgi:hypothetical protein